MCDFMASFPLASNYLCNVLRCYVTSTRVIDYVFPSVQIGRFVKHYYDYDPNRSVQLSALI